MQSRISRKLGFLTCPRNFDGLLRQQISNMGISNFTAKFGSSDVFFDANSDHVTTACLARREKRFHLSVGLGFGIGLGLLYGSGYWLGF